MALDAECPPVQLCASATVLTTDERFPRDPARRAGWLELAGHAGVSRELG